MGLRRSEPHVWSPALKAGDTVQSWLESVTRSSAHSTLSCCLETWSMLCMNELLLQGADGREDAGGPTHKGAQRALPMGPGSRGLEGAHPPMMSTPQGSRHWLSRTTQTSSCINICSWRKPPLAPWYPLAPAWGLVCRVRRALLGGRDG